MIIIFIYIFIYIFNNLNRDINLDVNIYIVFTSKKRIIRNYLTIVYLNITFSDLLYLYTIVLLSTI